MERKGKQSLSSVILCCLTVLFAATGHAEELRGKVISVSDGDTLTVLDSANQQRKVRLNGIDAPESAQDFGRVAKRILAAKVLGKEVVVIWRKMDRYQRLVGTVIADGVDVNLEQLRAGLAWYFREYERDVPVENRRPYAQAEAEARAARLGLWAQPNPLPPWEWRAKKTAQESEGSAPGPSPAPSSPVIGNRNSMIYHLPNCDGYLKVSAQNRVEFQSEADAEKAGYRRARNCP